VGAGNLSLLESEAEIFGFGFDRALLTCFCFTQRFVNPLPAPHALFLLVKFGITWEMLVFA
jgi:hypothetical protein